MYFILPCCRQQIQNDIETEKETDKETDKEKDKETDEEADRKNDQLRSSICSSKASIDSIEKDWDLSASVRPTLINPTPQRPSCISRIFVGLRYCFEQLGIDVTNRQLEGWAVLIHESMSVSSRNYHNADHIFEISKGWDDPIGIISAFFHDTIYCAVDGPLSKTQTSLLHDIFDEEKEKNLEVDELLRMCSMIFGIHEKRKMRENNEFLSCVTAVRALENVLDKSALVKIACCIEGTIPFRPILEDGTTAMDVLYGNLLKVNTAFNLEMDEDEMVESIYRAVNLANRDVGNFGLRDHKAFLDNSWSLLPETNKKLREVACFHVSDYQSALFKMRSFFYFLQPKLIFSSFRGFPGTAVIEDLEKNAVINLRVGQKYMDAKLLSISLMLAFALLTGGDAPMSLFTGDKSADGKKCQQLQDFLPEPKVEKVGAASLRASMTTSQTFDILARGRRDDSMFDIKKSPIAAYLYGKLGAEGVKDILKRNLVNPMTLEGARLLLNALPAEVVYKVASSVSKIAISRENEFRTLLEEYNPKKYEKFST